MTPPNQTGTGAGTAVPASSIPSTSKANTAAPHPALTRRVRLVKHHIHAGLPKRPGEEIELLHDLADWLVAEGAAKEIEPAVNLTPVLTPALTPASTPISTPPSTPKKEK